MATGHTHHIATGHVHHPDVPFQETTAASQRLQMCELVRSGALRVKDAAERFGVDRSTVRRWLARVEAGESAQGRSRRPLTSPARTSPSAQEPLLEVRKAHPEWGAGKILEALYPQGDAPFCRRTAERILTRQGLSKPAGKLPVKAGSFQREEPNELWQMDFKGLGRGKAGYWPLSLIDDSSRFLLALEPLSEQSGPLVFELLWRVFGEFGLPHSILSDNGSCFRQTSARGPSWLEARLWLLGVRTPHGRPYHPQTQGKVERFHRTLELEERARLRQESLELAKGVLFEFKERYNHVRPHHSLGGLTPAELYRASLKERPAKLPGHFIEQGSKARKVDAAGLFYFDGKTYRVGRGLKGQYVEIRECKEDLAALFAGRVIAHLQDLIV